MIWEIEEPAGCMGWFLVLLRARSNEREATPQSRGNLRA